MHAAASAVSTLSPCQPHTHTVGMLIILLCTADVPCMCVVSGGGLDRAHGHSDVAVLNHGLWHVRRRLYDNQLDGTIPDALGKCKKLRGL